MNPGSDRKFVVMGDPVTHSLSPMIHELFAKQFLWDIEYEPLQVTDDAFRATCSRLMAQSFKGANVTAPLKQTAFALMDQVSDRARHAKAINTITFREDHTMFGDNTDGIGLVRDLTKNCSIPIHDMKILVLGAGGAARGILRPILTLGPSKVVITNRTLPKAIELADYFKPWGKIRALPMEKIGHLHFDLILQATSAGKHLGVAVNETLIRMKDSICYDLCYGTMARPFLEMARQAGALCRFDGLGMLVEQAAESFFQWHGVRAQTDSVIQQLRLKLADETE